MSYAHTATISVNGAAPVMLSRTDFPDSDTFRSLAQYELPTLQPGDALSINVKEDPPSVFNRSLQLDFTAGDRQDNTPPVVAASLSIATAFLEAKPRSSCASQHEDRFSVTLSNVQATDDFGVAAYTAFENTSAGREYRLNRFYRPEPQEIYFEVDTTPGRRCFTLIAHDWAANQSAPQEICADFALPVADVESGGCTTTGTRSNSLCLAILLTAVLLLRRRTSGAS